MSKRLLSEQAIRYFNTLLQTVLGDRIFRIYTSYNVTVPLSWRIDPRVIDEFHLLYVKSGCATYQVNGENIALTAGSVLFLSDGVAHAAFRDLHTALSIIPIRFTINQYQSTAHSEYKTTVPCHFHFIPPEPTRLLVLFEAMHRYYCLPPSIRRDALCHTAVCQTLAEIIQNIEHLHAGVPVHPAILQIKNDIDTHPTQRQSVRQLTANTGLSSKYCSQLFQQLYGVSIKTYQIKVRIEYARYLLEHSNQSITEISQHLGYPDPFTFSKQFKAITGITPSQAIPKHRL